MKECKLKPGMLTYKDECGECPAGIGNKVYVCSSDGKPLHDIDGSKLYKIDLIDNGGGLTKEKIEKKDGYQITGTITLEDGKASETLKRLLYPRVRLPRKEKKRRMNNVMRHLQLKATIILLNSYSPRTGLMLALSLLYPDKLPMRVEVFGQPVFPLSETQTWLLCLLNKRLSKNISRILFREGGLRLVGRTTSDGDASAEIVVTRQQADKLRCMLALEELDRREDELLNGKED